MATFTDDWDTDRSSDDTNATEIDDYINKLATDLEERLKNWVYGFVAGENDGIGGLIYGKFKEQSSTPTTPASAFGLVAKDDTGTSLYALPESGGTAVKLLNASGQICAGAYAADTIDEDDIQLSNTGMLQGEVAATGSSADIIGLNASDVPVLADGAVLAAATEAGDGVRTVADKAYADTKEAAIVTQTTANLFGAWTTNDTTPAALALSTVYKAQCAGFLCVYDDDSDNTIIGYCDATDATTARMASCAETTKGAGFCMPVGKDDYCKITCTSAVTRISWKPFGTGGLVDQS